MAVRLLSWPAACVVLPSFLPSFLAVRDDEVSVLDTEWPKCTDSGKDYDCIPPLKKYPDYCFPTFWWGLERKGQIFGRGAFGQVRKAYHLNGHENDCEGVAAKVVNLKELADHNMEVEDVEREVEIQQSLDHVDILKMFGGGKTENGKEYVMFLELVGGGDLFDKVFEGEITAQKQQRYAYQLADAFRYVHSRGVAHLDIKLENVLLTDAANGDLAKVADFGLSEVVPKKEGTPQVWLSSSVFGQRREEYLQITRAKGTMAYMAPEMFTDPKFDAFKADVWSLGVMFYELFTGKELWEAAKTEGNPCFLKRSKNPAMTIQDVMKGCRKKTYELSKEYLSTEMDTIISQMLAVDPALRPDMQKVLSQLPKPATALLQLDEVPSYEPGQLQRPKATNNLASEMQKLMKL